LKSSLAQREDLRSAKPRPQLREQGSDSEDDVPELVENFDEAQK